ncbi:MAG: lytic murein transglycosylase [Elusimicrobiota bacterium]
MKLLVISILTLNIFFSPACASHNLSANESRATKQVLTGEKKEIYNSLKNEIKSPLFKELLTHPHFQIYDIRQKSKTYKKLEVNHFKSPQFGLFTPAGKKAATNFIENNKHHLTKAVQRFNLNREAIYVITAMAGMEYSWGNLNPPHKIFNSLISVYQNNSSPRSFVVSNVNGLLQAIEHPQIELDPFAPSSFMGAAGYCQLMPFWFTTIIQQDKVTSLDLDENGKFNPYTISDAIAFFAWRLKEGGFNQDKKTAIMRYIGSGTTASSYVTAVLDFAEEISDN